MREDNGGCKPAVSLAGMHWAWMLECSWSAFYQAAETSVQGLSAQSERPGRGSASCMERRGWRSRGVIAGDRGGWSWVMGCLTLTSGVPRQVGWRGVGGVSGRASWSPAMCLVAPQRPEEAGPQPDAPIKSRPLERPLPSKVWARYTN